MIRMTAEIEIYPSNGGEIQTDSVSITPDPIGTNVSAAIGDVVSMHKIGSNPFIFGASKLNNGEVFSSEEDYYIGKQLSNSETGAFTTPYVLTFDVKYKENVSVSPSCRIIFDTYYNAYSKNITVHLYRNGSFLDTSSAITNASPYFIFNLGYEISVTTSDVIEFRVTMSDWSMPGYPLRIQGIYTGLSIYGDRRNLLSISAPIKDRSDNEQPSYGIISNAGTLSLVDGTKEIKEYARLGLLTQDLDVQLWLEDTQSKKKQSIGKFKTDKWSYDDINFEVTVELKDNLVRLQDNIMDNQFELYYYPTTDGNYVISDVNALYIFSKLKTFTENLGFIVRELTDSENNFLTNFTIKKFYLLKDSIWNQWNKFSVITNCHIYEKDKTVYYNFDNN